MSVTLTVILPAFNEEAGLRAAVNAYSSALDAIEPDYELLIVNDASRDGTASIADELARTHDRVHVVHHATNQGQVQAILNGIRAARGTIITHNGIDLPFHPTDTATALAQMHAGADVVVVERIDRHAYSFKRWLLSKLNVGLLQFLFGSPFTDHNFVQFYRRDTITADHVVSRGVSTVTPELIFRAMRAGFRVETMPATYHERRTGQSSITLRKAWFAFRETLRLWWLLPPAVKLTPVETLS
jgi:glycosyltransferase involved in cell wall biosynthesis